MKKNNSFLTTLCVVIFGLFASGIGCSGGGGGGGGSSTGSGESGGGESGGGESGGGVIELSATDIEFRDHTFVLSNGVTIQFTYPNAGLAPPDVLDSVSGHTLDVFYADVTGNQRYQISSIGTDPLYDYELNVTWTSTTTGTLTGTYDEDIIDGIPAVAVTGNLTVPE